MYSKPQSALLSQAVYLKTRISLNQDMNPHKLGYYGKQTYMQ